MKDVDATETTVYFLFFVKLRPLEKASNADQRLSQYREIGDKLKDMGDLAEHGLSWESVGTVTAFRCATEDDKTDIH